ncbi:hypothetical protein SAMN05421747_1472 [Parapedobacter composti]|uniref:Uncharacterized protein n=1 Tax=Parapedobacter composti TaxID=623281 RepID=A0A1I1MTZ0_9SPHI|nr:hypothetical protein [Parapedobacter composti]SFC86668.1 hypothetical protein SAMN05421747_1472 [Parapedobacter composti]
MERTIYIKLLEEGTKVYRPVPAIELKENIYEVKGKDIYDPEDEVWEFKPRVHVAVEEQELDGELVSVAVREECR